jgi:hypothetical protein
MIIQCPSCGFSGRVPNYVAAVPHHARCPKCKFRFDLGALVSRIPESIDAPPHVELRHDLRRPRLDPSSSSYEIEALTEDFSDSDADRGEDWDDDWNGSTDRDDTFAPIALPIAPPPHLPKSDGRFTAPPLERDASLSPVATPWHYRLFQAWAILFILWALLIGCRAVLATINRDEAFLFSKESLWPVASVVLLVTSAAGLFSLMDLSRRFAAPANANTSPTPSASASVNGAIIRPNTSADPNAVKNAKLPTG